MLSGGQKTSFSARFCACFQILRSLPDSAKNSVGAESQNPGGTGFCKNQLSVSITAEYGPTTDQGHHVILPDAEYTVYH